MPAHSIGSATISFGLVSIPIKLYTAAVSAGERTCTLSIGITSRAGRLVEGLTLVEESRTAARKAAREGGNRVIGFRADPALFRDSLSASPG